MNKCYAINSETNYGDMVHIVMAKTREEAMSLATEDGSWCGCEIYELETSEDGVIWCSND